MSWPSGGHEKVKCKGLEIDDTLKERVFGAIRSGCEEIRPEGLTITEINYFAKCGFDETHYVTRELVDDGRVFTQNFKINGEGRAVNVYRITARPKRKEHADPPDPEPDPVTKKKKKTKKPRVMSSAARVKLIASRHKALVKTKKQREEKMDRRFGAEAETEDWSEDQ